MQIGMAFVMGCLTGALVACWAGFLIWAGSDAAKNMKGVFGLHYRAVPVIAPPRTVLGDTTYYQVQQRLWWLPWWFDIACGLYTTESEALGAVRHLRNGAVG